MSLLGCGGGKVAQESDFPIICSSNETPRVQEMHILIIHILCSVIENKLFPSN